MFLVSRVVDDRRCCRRKCHAGHTCIRRLVPLVKRASQTARFMLRARLNVYTGPIEGGGLADLVGARPRRLVLWVGEPNFWRRWPTIHLDGPCVGDDATHEGQPRNLQCPPVPTPAPACIPGRPTSAPPPAPKSATTSGRTRGAVRGCVCPIFPPPDRTALGGAQYGSTWHPDTHTHTHIHPRRPCPAASRVRSQSVPRFVQGGAEHRYRAYVLMHSFPE